MPLSSNNCYVTLEDADTYFSDRLETEAWDEADDLQKSKALVTATRFLDNKRWAGVASDENQPLAFPRSGSYFNPRLGRYISFTDSIPDDLKYATYEMALHLLTNESVLSSTGSVKELTVGPIELIDVKDAPPVPSNVSRLIRPLLQNGGSRNWYRSW